MRLSKKTGSDVAKLYDKLRPELTSNCVRVLVAIENGENSTRSELRGKVYPELKFKEQYQRDRAVWFPMRTIGV